MGLVRARLETWPLLDPNLRALYILHERRSTSSSGESNAMFSVFSHVRVFTRAHPKVTFCEVERSVLEGRATRLQKSKTGVRWGRT
jgi:hypothetical protein